MNWLIIFLGVWPFALALLVRFAARIDPSSGHWRGRQAAKQASRDVLQRFGRYCLQRITIDRFFTFAPKMPPIEPPEVAPLSTSFDTTSYP